MESSSIFGAEKMEPNDFENNEKALVALRDDDAASVHLPIGMKCQENTVVGL